MQKPPRQKKPTKTGNHLAPEFAGFFGKTGSGKSTALWEKFTEWRGTKQVLVWSPKELQDDYAKRLRCKAYRDMHTLVKAARAGKNVVFASSLNRADDEQKFDLFNRLALNLAPCIVIVDELHTVTKPTGGVPGWRNNTLIGRASGLSVLAASPRPAHVDKDFFGALSYVWVGCQLYPEDAKAVSGLVLKKPEEIMHLSGHNAFTRSM